MKKQAQTQPHHARGFAIRQVAAVLLGVMALSTQALAATGNVDVYGITYISIDTINEAEYVATLIESGENSAQAGLGLPNLALFGAHHRSLLDSGLVRKANGACAWATVDATRHNSSDYRAELAEAGVCKDIGNARLGVGVGQAWSRQDRLLGGKTDYEGQYLIAEVANAYSNGMEVSLTGYYGRFDTDMRRNYTNGAGVDSSIASPDAQSVALRARIDWKDISKLGQFSLSPYAAYTWSETKLDAYTETGGGLPQQFDSTTWRVQDIRMGAAAKTSLSANTDLRLALEAAHRFDSNTGGVTGPSINLPGQIEGSTRAHVMLDVDHRLSNTTALTFGAGASGSDDGDSWGWGLTAGLRTNF
jgi:Autotransporter beta-domain